MARKSQAPDSIPPDLTLEKGREAITVMKQKGELLLSQRPINKEHYRTWRAGTTKFINRTFGTPNDHQWNFDALISMRVITSDYEASEEYQEPERAEELKKSIDCVASIIEQIDVELKLASPEKLSGDAPDDLLLRMLHPRVVAVASSLFKTGHYAEAVEAALKELDNEVKKTAGPTVSAYGTSLMFAAFSADKGSPKIQLADISTASGKDMQEGYQHIFAGTMLGIRNPKTHGNLTIKRSRAVQFLFLATLLFEKLDERIVP